MKSIAVNVAHNSIHILHANNCLVWKVNKSFSTSNFENLPGAPEPSIGHFPRMSVLKKVGKADLETPQ